MKYTVLSQLRSLSDAQLADLALRMAEQHPDSFERLLCSVSENVYHVNGNVIKLTSSNVHELRTLGANSNTYVTCIKRAREITGLGLKDAKDFIDREFKYG